MAAGEKGQAGAHTAGSAREQGSSAGGSTSEGVWITAVQQLGEEMGSDWLCLK